MQGDIQVDVVAAGEVASAAGGIPTPGESPKLAHPWAEALPRIVKKVDIAPGRRTKDQSAIPAFTGGSDFVEGGK